jgi:hypothetical protein
MLRSLLSGSRKWALGLVREGIVFLVTVSFLSSAHAQIAITPPGSGSAADPFQLSQLGHLVWLADNVASSGGRFYKVQNNIDASATAGLNGGAGFEPIGSSGVPFLGNFNGNGKTVSNLVIYRPTQDNVGLFGYVGDGGAVNDTGLVQATVTGDYDVGGLVGDNHGSVRGCSSTGAVNGQKFVGGLVGYSPGTVSRCYASGTVTGGAASTDCGGLVGCNDYGVVSNCFASGSVSGGNGVGGLVGINDGAVSRCYATGPVSGINYVGGLVGGSFDGTAANSYWNIQTSGQSLSSGGDARTTAQMKQQATFVGWDFSSTWGISENLTYPFFLSIDVYVPDSGPDFVVSALQMTPPDPAVGKTFTAKATVLNQGTTSGSVGNLSLWINHPAVAVVNESPTKRSSVGTLGPGQSRVVTFTGLVAPLQAGGYTLRAFVDSAGRTVEGDESNNQATLAYQAGAPYVDLEVVDVDVAPLWPLPGGPLTTYVTVQNRGNVPSPATRLSVWSSQTDEVSCGAAGGVYKTVKAIPPWTPRRETVKGVRSPAAAGDYVLRAFVDSVCAVGESTENNNQGTMPYAVATPPANDGSTRTSVGCELQVEPGNGFGFQSVDDGGSALGSLGEMTVNGRTINIVAQGNAEICGSLVGLPGQQRQYLAGSYIKWNSTPSAGQNLSGTFRFVLDTGTYEGTINVPGADVQSGTPYQIHSERSVFSIGKK